MDMERTGCYCISPGKREQWCGLRGQRVETEGRGQI